MSTIRPAGLSTAPGNRAPNGDSSARLRAPDVTAAPVAAPRNPRRDNCFSILAPSLTPAPRVSYRLVGRRLNDVSIPRRCLEKSQATSLRFFHPHGVVPELEDPWLSCGVTPQTRAARPQRSAFR